MDLEDLRTFVEVAEAGGVSPAARWLGVRLMRLEQALGIQLVNRRQRLALTPILRAETHSGR